MYSINFSRSWVKVISRPCNILWNKTLLNWSRFSSKIDVRKDVINSRISFLKAYFKWSSFLQPALTFYNWNILTELYLSLFYFTLKLKFLHHKWWCNRKCDAVRFITMIWQAWIKYEHNKIFCGRLYLMKNIEKYWKMVTQRLLSN